MSRCQHYDYAQTVMIPLSLEKQLTPGTLEFAIHVLVQRCIDTSIFADRYTNDATGCPAYDPHYGPVAPLLDGAKATVPAIGLPEGDWAGQLLRADSNYHSAGNWAKCAQEHLDAAIPDPHFQARELRFATQDRPQPPTDETLTIGDCTYNEAHEHSLCPNGKV